MTSFFETALRNLGQATGLNANDIIFAGRAALVKLGDDRYAKLEIKENGVADNYEKVTVKIFSKSIGKIDEVDFLFKDYFEPARLGIPYIWDDFGEIRWYEKPTTEDKHNLARAVRDYVRFLE